MKPDALRHLLLAAARSARRLVPAADAARIDAMALTLTVTRPERGRYRITWSAAEGAAAHDIDAGRFDFYRRGDVVTVVGRRPAGLDARGANWLEAHRVWGELLGAPTLAGLVAAPSRAGHAAAGAGHADRYGAWTGAISALAPAGAALAAAPALVLAVLAALAGTGVALAGRVRAVPAAAAVAAGVAVAVLLDVMPSDLRRVTAGVALLLGSCTVAPANRRGQRPIMVVGALTVALAAPVAGPTWLGAGAVAVLADAAALAVRRERTRLMGLAAAIAAAALVAVGIAATTDIDSTVGGSNGWVSAAVAVTGVALCAVGVWRAACGVHDRLSSWLGLPAAALAVLGSTFDAATAVVSAALAAAVVGAAARSAMRLRSQRSTAASHERTVASARPQRSEVPVAIGGRSGRR